MGWVYSKNERLLNGPDETSAYIVFHNIFEWENIDTVFFTYYSMFSNSNTNLNSRDQARSTIIFTQDEYNVRGTTYIFTKS